MAKKEHLKILEKGVNFWNKWRINNHETIPDLKGVDLRAKNLIGIDFMNADLSYANLSRANLSRASLSGAKLIEANLNNTILRNAYILSAYLNKASLKNAILDKADLSCAFLVRADLRNASLSETDLTWTILIGADLTGADLEFSILINTDFTDAYLSDCSIYGISTWDLILKNTIQKNLRITRRLPLTPHITVDNIEVAQFIYLLLNNEKIRHIIDTITTKVVLILGSFNPERKIVLEAIRDELRNYDYITILFDFDKPINRDTQETLTTLARLSKFIIADITSPKSIPQELISIVETLPSVPVQPLLVKGKKRWGMYDHIKRYISVLPLQYYQTLNELKILLKEKIITNLEAKVIELRSKN